MLLGELTQKIGFEVHDNELHGLAHKLEAIHKTVELIAAVEIVRGLWELSERFSSMGEHLESTAIAAGLTTEELQKLQFAASQNAVGGDELAGALAKLNRNLYQARQGSKSAIAVFAKLGIGPEQIASFKNSSDALAGVQDAIAGVDDANERQALTMQLFGRGSSNMIKFLVAGSAATKDLGDSAAKMGAVVSDDGIKALAEFEDAASGLKQVFTSFMATVGATFAPAFREVILLLERSWSDNLGTMRSSLQVFAEKAAFWIGYTAEGFRLLIKIIMWFVEDHMGLIMFVLKWGPAFVAASLGLEAIINAINKGTKAWAVFGKVAPKAILALNWSLEKIQLISLTVLNWGIQFVGLFSPALAKNITNASRALAEMSSLRFFLLLAGWAAAIAAIVVVLHDLYEMLWNGKSFKDTWIGQALDYFMKFLDPVGEKLRKLINRGVDKITGYRDVGLETGTFEANRAGRSLMSVAAQTPAFFGAAAEMGQKFNANDTSLTLPYQKAAQRIDMPVNIVVPPNMSTNDAIRVAKEGVGSAFQEFLAQTDRDVTHAAAR